MLDLSNRLKTTDPVALASRFGSKPPPPPPSRAAASAPGPQARADMALIGHLRAQAQASLALRDDMWAPAAPVIYTPAPARPRRSLLDALI